MVRYLWLAALGVGLVLANSGTARAQEEMYRPTLEAKDIDSNLETQWFGLYLQGKKIGYARTERLKKGGVVTESFQLHMKLVSFGKKAEMDIGQETSFADKAPYKLVRAKFLVSDGINKQIFHAERRDDGFELTTDISGQKNTRQLGAPDYTLADAMATEMWIKSVPKVGEKISYRDFDVQEWRVDDASAKLAAIKNSLVGGVEVKFFEVETESRKEKIRFLTRQDEKGQILSGKIAIFEMRRETEELAKNVQFSQDLFVLGMAKADRPLGRTTKLTELVLEVPAKEAKVFEEGPRQTLEPGPDGTVRIKIGARYGKVMKASKKEMEDALAENVAHPISNAAVQELAKQAIGDAETPKEKVKRIVAFTHKFINPHLAATMPNVHDLMKRKEGDCKSYALLTTNLCRAVGVPAREVSGLLYMGDDTRAFGGHAWNEVLLDGMWVPVDASLGETEVDAGHIFFGAENKALQNILESLGRLSFRVVEFKTK